MSFEFRTIMKRHAQQPASAVTATKEPMTNPRRRFDYSSNEAEAVPLKTRGTLHDTSEDPSIRGGGVQPRDQTSEPHPRDHGIRVLFLEVDTESTWAIASIGPAYLAPWIRQHGHAASFFRVPLDMPASEVMNRIREEKPDLLALSLTTRQWQRARALVREIRTHLDVPVIAGGLHPTFAPEEVLRNPGFDYVCMGEGENPMLDLCNALADGTKDVGIPNIWKRGAANPGMRPPFDPLDRLPYLAREFLDEHNGVIHMCTQRGCPFPCTYCAARMYNELYAGQDQEYGRRRSHDSVLDELRTLDRAGQLAYVIFLDDTFTINHPWVRDFCRLYGAEIGKGFSLHARVETVNERMLHELAAAGCKHITYGVESGSYRVRRDIMQRPVKNERFLEVFHWTRDAGIMVTANYMIGLPGETREDLEETIRLAEVLPAYDFGYFVFYPYPGTQLFRECQARGYLPEDYLDLPANHRESILKLDTLTQQDIAEYYDRFTRLREDIYLERQSEYLSEVQQAQVRQQIRLAAACG